MSCIHTQLVLVFNYVTNYVTFLLAQNTNFNFNVVQLLKSALLYNCDTMTSLNSLAMVLIEVQHTALSPNSLLTV